MRICENGVYRDETEDEKRLREEWEQSQMPPTPSPEERIAELEEELMATKILLGVE